MGAAQVKSSASSIWDNISTFNNTHIVMVGLDYSGKTTALYRLKFGQYINAVPTIGFNCEKVRVQYKNRCLNFTIWDIGGQDKLRPLWKSYTRGTDGIVFVIDSVDEERFEEAKMELLKTARLPENKNVPILILANKQDLPRAKEAREISNLLSLDELTSNHLWHVQPSCAVIGDGLDEGLNVLYEMICKRKKLAKVR